MIKMKLIAANWKMNKTINESISLAQELKKLLSGVKSAEIVVFPPFTALNAVSKELKGSNILLGAQNMHFMDSGAYTGEISPLMLKDAGCRYVILGHSERRELFSEDDFTINKKITAALHNGLAPILCVGESLEQRSSARAKEVVESQLRNCLKGINPAEARKISVAYEPIWAISKGSGSHKPATADDAEDMHKFIMCALAGIFNEEFAMGIRIIYGGSIKPDNAKKLLSMPNIDGGLVGNASLDANSFAEIVRCCN